MLPIFVQKMYFPFFGLSSFAVRFVWPLNSDSVARFEMPERDSLFDKQLVEKAKYYHHGVSNTTVHAVTVVFRIKHLVPDSYY